MVHNSKLEAKVAAVNAGNKYAVELYDKLAPIFKEYLNQKIFKADGQLLAKIAAKIPELPNKDALKAYFRSSDYSLMWMVCTCEHYKESDGYASSESYDIGLYIGEMSNGVLTSVIEKPNYKYDYSATEITAKRYVYEQARKSFELARNDLFPFGER